jgi:hypothetical protein
LCYHNSGWRCYFVFGLSDAIAHTFTDADSNSKSVRKADREAVADSIAQADSDSNTEADCHADSGAYGYADADSNSHTFAHPLADANSLSESDAYLNARSTDANANISAHGHAYYCADARTDFGTDTNSHAKSITDSFGKCRSIMLRKFINFNRCFGQYHSYRYRKLGRSKYHL